MIFSYIEKESLLPMQQMVLAMGFGMTCALTVGVLAGVIEKDSLLHSTMIGMVIGVGAGILSGMFFGVLPAVEGAFSGLMGGMMGAMLGEMLMVSDAVNLLMVLLTLCWCSVILIFVLRSGQEKLKAKWIWKPIMVVILIGGYLFLGIHLSHGFGKERPSEDYHGHH
ncbi:MAG: hypothetical protein ACQEV7_19130 [Bacillota bacterium]